MPREVCAVSFTFDVQLLKTCTTACDQNDYPEAEGHYMLNSSNYGLEGGICNFTQPAQGQSSLAHVKHMCQFANVVAGLQLP